MTQQHLHAKLGDAISECKKRMFKRLASGAELEDVIAQFIGELRLAMEIVLRESKT